MRVFALTVLLASGAYAQPVIGPELSTDTLPTQASLLPLPGRSIAVVSAEGNLVLAWIANGSSGRTRAFIARLDSEARQIGATRELPASQTDAAVENLSLARTANGFAVAWLEPQTSKNARAVITVLDRNLVPIAGPKIVAETAGLIQLGSLKGDLVAIVGGRFVRFGADGSIVDSFSIGPSADDVAFGADQLVLVTHTSSQTVRPFLCPHGCPPPITVSSYDLIVIFPTAASLLVNHFNYFSSLAPAIAASSSGFLIAWYDGSNDGGGNVVAAHVDPIAIRSSMILGRFSHEAEVAKPSIAWDGDRNIVVWQDAQAIDHDIRGAAITNDGIERFTVASSDADERRPIVIAVRRGRFLVAYESTRGGQRRLAGRFIDFPPSRQRVAH